MEDVRKRCSKCRKNILLEEFYKDKSRKDGRGFYCKKCKNKMRNSYSAKMMKRKDISIPDIKKCSQCGKVKLSERFIKQSRSKDGMLNWCKSCNRKYVIKCREKLKNRKYDEIKVPLKKRCSQCSNIKESIFFDQCKSRIDGLNNRCKVCSSRCNKKYREEFKSRKDSEIVTPLCKTCCLCRKVKVSSEFRKYKQNKDGLLGWCKACSKVYSKKYNKEWQETHKEEIKIYRREYLKERRRTDPGFRILGSLRARLGCALREQNAKKSKRSMELIGCSIDELKRYLESKFLPKMSWDNYGMGDNRWVIDHIRPCASYDLTNPSEQLDCFNWKNMRPLWGKDNLAKGESYIGKTSGDKK